MRSLMVRSASSRVSTHEPIRFSSFETPRKGAAPQDEVCVCSRHVALEMVMRRSIWTALIAMLAFGGSAFAETFPSHPITIVVPFSAGGPSDAMARILAERMKVTLGEALVIENVTGAGGSIGVGRAGRSPPDGYTISFGHLGTHVANGAIYKLGYDVLADPEPVVLLPSNTMIVVSKNAVPAKSLSELLAWLRSRPETAGDGTARAGSRTRKHGQR